MAATINSPSGASNKPMVYFGKGTYGTEIQFLEIKFFDVTLYIAENFDDYLHDWASESKDALLAEGSGFFKSLCNAPVDKIVKFDIIKEVKGSQFGKPLQICLRDRLAINDEFDAEEEDILGQLVDYFQRERPWLAKHTLIYFHWPSPKKINIYIVDSSDSPGDLAKLLENGQYYTISNEKVAHAILEWIIGEDSFSPSLLDSIASSFKNFHNHVS